MNKATALFKSLVHPVSSFLLLVGHVFVGQFCMAAKTNFGPAMNDEESLAGALQTCTLSNMDSVLGGKAEPD